ncbi:MAG: molybdenum cofactor guanylyltransferase, partial [Aggregatilineales bacterium]
MANFTLAIVAGGKSTRMGRDKSFVPLNGRPLIEHVLERTRDLGQAETILIVNQPALYAHLGLPMFADLLPDKGSLGGIYTAIHHSGTPYTLCVACDMPFLNARLLRYQVSLAPD